MKGTELLTVGTDRPYPERHSPEDWQRFPPVWVIWDDLTTTQDGVYIEALLTPADVHVDPYPYVVIYDGRAYLEDGHTRVCRSVLHGYNGGLCRVRKVDSQ